MKQFACGAIVPGCTKVFEAESTEQILAQVEGHARSDHGVETVSDELADRVRQYTIDI